LRAHDLDDGVDQDARREVLAGAGLGILRILFEEAFVDIALDVGAEGAPGFLVDEIDDEAAQVGGILDFVLGFAENDAEKARLFAEIFQGVAVMSFERQAVQFDEAGSVVVFGDGGLVFVGRAGALVVHFEEKKIGELLDVIAVGDSVVAEEVAIVPDFVDQVGGGGRHQERPGFAISLTARGTMLLSTSITTLPTSSNLSRLRINSIRKRAPSPPKTMIPSTVSGWIASEGGVGSEEAMPVAAVAGTTVGAKTVTVPCARKLLTDDPSANV